MRRSLRRAHSAAHNLGLSIVLAAHRMAGEPSEHSDLADVRERVGNRRLE